MTLKLSPSTWFSALHGNAFTPEQDPDILAWWDAQRSVVTTGTTVDTWTDQISSWILAPGVAPNYDSRTANNKTLLEFDGTEYLTRASTQMPTSGNQSVILYVEIDTINNSSDSVIAEDLGVDWQFDSGNTPNFESRITAAAGGPAIAASGTNRTGANVFSLVFDFTNNDAYVYRNNVLESSALGVYTSKIGTVTQLVTMLIFSNRGLTQFPVGAIGDVIITESVDRTGTVSDHASFLMTKYGI